MQTTTKRKYHECRQKPEGMEQGTGLEKGGYGGCGEAECSAAQGGPAGGYRLRRRHVWRVAVHNQLVRRCRVIRVVAWLALAGLLFAGAVSTAGGAAQSLADRNQSIETGVAENE
jgi:hypothetical protein